MKTFKKITAVASIVIGIVFILVGGSDIQLGFGLVLITNGIANF